MKIRTTTLLVAAVLTGTACSGGEESGSVEAVDAFAMEVGDCFDDSFFGPAEVSEVPGVPCAEPHDNEVYALFDLPGGAFPGDEQVEALADQGCYERFQAAIGASYEESVLMYTTMYPTVESWEQIGDREVICIAYHMETDKLTGSVLGSGM